MIINSNVIVAKHRHGLVNRGTIKTTIISATLGTNVTPGDNYRGRSALGSGGRPNHVCPTKLPGSENKMLGSNFRIAVQMITNNSIVGAGRVWDREGD